MRSLVVLCALVAVAAAGGLGLGGYGGGLGGYGGGLGGGLLLGGGLGGGYGHGIPHGFSVGGSVIAGNKVTHTTSVIKTPVVHTNYVKEPIVSYHARPVQSVSYVAKPVVSHHTVPVAIPVSHGYGHGW